MIGLYAVTAIAFLISLLIDRERTIKAVKIGWKKFTKILPGYLKILMILSVVLLVPNEIIARYLGESSSYFGIIVAGIFGSITMMPGFIAYPLAGVFLDQGVSYMVIAAFVTTLMMVGVATYPVEKQYFGKRSTIIRNVTAFGIAMIIALSMGLFYGELI
ncbi:hypothetical protein [Isachenkonia alkalipeptolytica]|uniref:Permease n=1 Tax=Isachenkonia alkalipeptolytica TaxID=2565777 RepID=A0AA44BD86_9CLOT|nr:hypothetical protein [Isachenkonia alkalipeptolytica]NBG86910.1 hypothetical protein [Isachenkonia alkalipeptolytica]